MIEILHPLAGTHALKKNSSIVHTEDTAIVVCLPQLEGDSWAGKLSL